MTTLWLILKTNRAAQIGLAALALLIAAALWLHFHDAAVIDNHEAQISEQVTNATTAANDTANTNDAKRQAENARADERTKGAIANAEAQNSEAARAPAGPVSRAAADSLRERARKVGNPAR